MRFMGEKAAAKLSDPFILDKVPDNSISVGLAQARPNNMQA